MNDRDQPVGEMTLGGFVEALASEQPAPGGGAAAAVAAALGASLTAMVVRLSLDRPKYAEHAALHGLVFKWDDPFWDSHTPPWDYGCRCYVVPLTEAQVRRMGVRVRNVGYVRKRIRVPGQGRRGIGPNPRFVRGKFNLEAIDRELREAVEGMVNGE